MQPRERLARCWGCDRPLSRGLPPSQLWVAGCTWKEVLENWGEIFTGGVERSVARPSSGYGWKRWYPRCWEAPEHPPAARLLMGLLLVEGEEKAVLPRVLAVRDGRKLRSWAVPDILSHFARVVLTLLRPAVASML